MLADLSSLHVAQLARTLLRYLLPIKWGFASQRSILHLMSRTFCNVSAGFIRFICVDLGFGFLSLVIFQLNFALAPAKAQITKSSSEFDSCTVCAITLKCILSKEIKSAGKKAAVQIIAHVLILRIERGGGFGRFWGEPGQTSMKIGGIGFF